MNRNILSRGLLAGVALAALAIAACATADSASQPSESQVPSAYASLSGELKASGASFPNAFYQKALDEFAKLAPNLTITYESTGSGTGKQQFGSGLTDFAGTDSLVKKGDGPEPGTFYYIPTVAAPITVSYNLSGVNTLRLSPDTLAKIFQRDITNWSDPAIAADNPGVTLPNKPIAVVHRSDGSGTTNNFTKYLVAAAPSWRLGSGDSVAWPADTQGGDKNTGVAQLIKQSDGSIGYVDFADATASGLSFAAIKNKEGNYVAASLEGATAALAGAEVKEDLTFDPLNAAGANTYPITAPTYILVRTSYSDANTAKNVKAFLRWLLTDGQEYADDVNYARLPGELAQLALAQLDKVRG